MCFIHILFTLFHSIEYLFKLRRAKPTYIYTKTIIELVITKYISRISYSSIKFTRRTKRTEIV